MTQPKVGQTQIWGGVLSTNTLASVAQYPSSGHEECGPSDLATVFKIQEEKNKGRGAMPVASHLDILPGFSCSHLSHLHQHPASLRAKEGRTECALLQVAPGWLPG